MSGVSHLIESWKAEQHRRRALVRVEPLKEIPRYVAGADAAFSSDKQTIFAVAVVYDREARAVIDIARAKGEVKVPYISGFLSFREGPTVLAAIQSLTHPFGAICFDGQGLAHPRRCGLATHLGVELDVPSIGMAKSVLIGTFDEPGEEPGSTSPMVHKGETVGWALRTRRGVKPIYLSIGTRIDLPGARDVAMACLTKYRIPEPTRQADREVARSKLLP